MQSRARVIAAAADRGLPVRCLSLETSVEDAQVNAVQRMVARHRRLLTPNEIRATSKRDVSVFGPGVQFRYQRELEPPDASEGFSAIDTSRSSAARCVLRQQGADRLVRRRAAPQPIGRADAAVDRRCGASSPSGGEALQEYAADGWRAARAVMAARDRGQDA